MRHHPEQTSDALGAAAVQYGPPPLRFAADLKHRVGASYRKCSSGILTLTGLVVASAALVRGGKRPRRMALPGYGRRVETARAGLIRREPGVLTRRTPPDSSVPPEP